MYISLKHGYTFFSRKFSLYQHTKPPHSKCLTSPIIVKMVGGGIFTLIPVMSFIECQQLPSLLTSVIGEKFKIKIKFKFNFLSSTFKCFITDRYHKYEK